MRKIKCFLASLTIALALMGPTGSLSADHYVAANSTNPLSPYTTLATAATNIQDAVSAAEAGSTVWVAPGIYYALDTPANSSVVSITKSLTLRGTTGNPADVIVNGAATYRCLFMYAAKDTTIIVDGLTLSNGFFSAATQSSGGAGAYFAGSAGGAATLQNSVVNCNKAQGIDSSLADIGGGGIYAYTAAQIIVSNCTVIGNQTLTETTSYMHGGGVFGRGNFLITDSLIAQNEAKGNGGGLWLRDGTVKVQRCSVISNSAVGSTASGIYLRSSNPEVSHTLVAYNTSRGIHADYSARIFNCTSVLNAGDGVYIGKSVTGGIMDNCIVDKVTLGVTPTATCYNNCIPSIPDNSDNCVWANSVFHAGDLDFIKFADIANGDFRLKPDSPCVNKGIDREAQFTEALDLDRKQRIDHFFKVIDIGCYEYLPNGTLFYLK